MTNDARNLEIASNQTFAPRIFDRLGLLGTYRPGLGPLELASPDVDHYVQSELERSRALSNDIQLYGQLRVLPETLVRLEVCSVVRQLLRLDRCSHPFGTAAHHRRCRACCGRWRFAFLRLWQQPHWDAAARDGAADWQPGGVSQRVRRRSGSGCTCCRAPPRRGMRATSSTRFMPATCRRPALCSLRARAWRSPWFVRSSIPISEGTARWWPLPTLAIAPIATASPRAAMFWLPSLPKPPTVLDLLEVGASYSALDNETDFGFCRRHWHRNDAAFAKTCPLAQKPIWRTKADLRCGC